MSVIESKEVKQWFESMKIVVTTGHENKDFIDGCLHLIKHGKLFIEELEARKGKR